MMSKIFAAIALTIALPAVAAAQAAPTGKGDCCEKMKADGKGCMSGEHSTPARPDAADAHAGHDMAQPATKAPPAVVHQQ